MNALDRPDPAEVPAFYHGYIALAPGHDLVRAIHDASDRERTTLARITPDLGDHRYAPGKWSVKEVIQHVIDAERIFAYRALRFARNDATELAGFDENTYAPNAQVDRRELVELTRELELVRACSTALFQSFSTEMLLRTGTANGNRISVRGLGWVIAGHTTHHMNVLEQRYL
ncbi:MAG: DinB family protein [Flavobacteriales bacterium]